MIKNKNLIAKILLILTNRNWFVSAETRIIEIVSLILNDIFNKNIIELKNILKKGGKTIKKGRATTEKKRNIKLCITMVPKNYTKRRRLM